MLRLYLCMGDQPETGGQIVPYGGPLISFYGHQAAMIGAHVYCNACKRTGVLAKAGGPCRFIHHNSEIALDGDILLCNCLTPPRMIASMQDNARHDDLAESLGIVVSSRTADGGASSVLTGAFDEQIAVTQCAEIEGYPYFIETKDRRVCSGRVGADLRLQRVHTDTADSYTVFWGDEALARQAGV